MANIETWNVLPYPQFLSEQIQRYIAETAQKAGRHIMFVDMSDKEYRRLFRGKALGNPNEPVAAVALDRMKINPSTYVPDKHDPIVAHELTHIHLWFEGWLRVKTNAQSGLTDQQKVEAVTNWLTDPLINERIYRLGFDMTPIKVQEIIDASVTMRLGLWNRDSEARVMHASVSYLLEPDIPNEVIEMFSEAFKFSMPNHYEKAAKFFNLIRKNGFGTPEEYERTAYLCLQQWQVNTRAIQFVPMERFTTDEWVAWARNNATPDIGWE